MCYVSAVTGYCVWRMLKRWRLSSQGKHIKHRLYLDSASAGCPLLWSMTCIWGISGAYIWTSAPPRLRCTSMLQNQRQNMQESRKGGFIWPLSLVANILPPDFARRGKTHVLPKYIEHVAAKHLYLSPKCKAKEKVSLKAGSGKPETSFFYVQCSYTGNQEQ